MSIIDFPWRWFSTLVCHRSWKKSLWLAENCPLHSIFVTNANFLHDNYFTDTKIFTIFTFFGILSRGKLRGSNFASQSHHRSRFMVYPSAGITQILTIFHPALNGQMNRQCVVIHLYLFGLLRWHSYVHTIYRTQWPVRATTDSDAAMLSQQDRAAVITHF
jgi:hypothetical protein